MSESQPRRSPKVIDPDASLVARLGFELRRRRREAGLTLRELAALIGFSIQHISEVELASATMSPRFVAACDLALNAHGGLLELLQPVICERALHLQHESLVRQRAEGALSDAEWEALTGTLEFGRYAGQQYLSATGARVDLNRRSLFGAGVGAALSLGTTTAPATAREIDPELVQHWMTLLRVLFRQDAMFGPHDVLAIVRREIATIAAHREIARGELYTELLRVESRWSEFAGWLSNDTGDLRGRNAWADRAAALAREIGYQDMVAWIFLWQSRWAVEERNAQRAITSAEAAARTPGTSEKIRALCALKEAQGHALANDATSCEHRLGVAHAALKRVVAETSPDDLGGHAVTPHYVLADEAHCWRPRKAIATFEEVLRLWPHDRPRGRGVQQARLAMVCAAANEPERAAAEGVKALSMAQATKSHTTIRELKRLDQELAGFDTVAVGNFRAAFAAL